MALATRAAAAADSDELLLVCSAPFGVEATFGAAGPAATFGVAGFLAAALRAVGDVAWLDDGVAAPRRVVAVALAAADFEAAVRRPAAVDAGFALGVAAAVVVVRPVVFLAAGFLAVAFRTPLASDAVAFVAIAGLAAARGLAVAGVLVVAVRRPAVADADVALAAVEERPVVFFAPAAVGVRAAVVALAAGVRAGLDAFAGADGDAAEVEAAAAGFAGPAAAAGVSAGLVAGLAGDASAAVRAAAGVVVEDAGLGVSGIGVT